MKLKLVWEAGAAHYRLRVFLGPDHDHFALTGFLMLRPHEALELRGILRGGGWQEVDGVFEAGWVDPDDQP